MALPEILRGILAKRGVVTDEEVEKFLNPSLGDLAKPEELPGVTEAAEKLISAVRRGREMVVFGDYDCDGICATAIMVKVLLVLKARVSPFIPERQTEGYGMGENAVRRMLKEHPRVGLVVTVDNGINSVDRVNELRRRDIEVIVTDHHLPGEELPKCPVVNPKVAAPPRLEQLCGAAVAFMLASRLVARARELKMYDGGKLAGELLILAGLATVTDIMPLLGQNRILVAEALKRFRTLAPVGLNELYIRAARTISEELNAKDFSFLLGPRINAAGRMASGSEALDLIMTGDREAARQMAVKVDMHNLERKSREQAMVDEAVKAVAKMAPDAPAQVIDIPDGHQGVSGIVASRMVDRQERAAVPVCVIVARRGSARAPDGYNVRDAFVAAADALEDYGGHAAAGGFTVKPGRIDDFRRLFTAACEAQRAKLVAAGQEPAVSRVDAEVPPEDVTIEFAEAVRRLEPFGECNPEPVFRLKGVRLMEVRTVGSDGKHLCLTARKDDARIRGVWWGAGDQVEDLRSGSGLPFDIDFHVEISDFQERHVELRILRISPAQ